MVSGWDILATLPQIVIHPRPGDDASGFADTITGVMTGYLRNGSIRADKACGVGGATATGADA